MYENRHDSIIHPIILGSPGVGKTSVVYQLFGDLLQVPVYVFQASLYDVVELKGLPVYVDGKARFVPFTEMPSGDKGVLFVDDLPHAPNMTQNAFMRIILEGKAGSWDIGNLYPIGAGNRGKDRAGAKDLQTAMGNRFVHLEFTVEYPVWRIWAVQKNLCPEVISFLGSEYGAEWLDKFSPDRVINPTPRSWQFASDIWRQNVKRIDDIKSPVINEMIAGCVGDEATKSFLGWVEVFGKLPDIEAILAGKDIVSKDLNIQYAVISTLTSKVAKMIQGKKKPEKVALFQRLLDYTCAFPKEGLADMGAYMAKDLLTLDEETFRDLNLKKWREAYPLTQYT
jgi:GTPase SAR1 family protein